MTQKNLPMADQLHVDDTNPYDHLIQYDVTSRTMAPRFMPGEVVLVDPKQLPVVGKCVRASIRWRGRMKTGLWRLNAQDAESVTLEQYRPRRLLHVQRQDLKSMAKIRLVRCGDG
jgi:hypothetical protein